MNIKILLSRKFFAPGCDTARYEDNLPILFLEIGSTGIPILCHAVYFLSMFLNLEKSLDNGVHFRPGSEEGGAVHL